MEKLMTLEKLWDRVEALGKNCFDQHIPAQSISFLSLETVQIGLESHSLRPVAQRAFANRLGIPFHYLQKCPRDLQAENMNHWVAQEKNENLFFRFDGDEIRAVFTPRYQPVDNFQVLERLDSMGYGLETEVQCHLDGEFMSLAIPDSRKTFRINGDEMTPGISIANSEVGLSSLSIAAFMLRLICTNGLITRTEISASYRHISTRILEEFPEVLNKVSHEISAQQGRLRLSTESRVDDPLATIKSFNRQFALGKQEKEAVEWAWPQEAGDTMFHIVNAYTRAAQFSGLSAESSHQLQKVGGDVLSMLK